MEHSNPVNIQQGASHVITNTTTSSCSSNSKSKHGLPLLLFLSSSMIATGIGGTLLTRIYFLHGGTRVWLPSLLQVVGWPITLVPLYFFYAVSDRATRTTEVRPIFYTTWRMATACLLLGVLLGVDVYLYSYGLAYLPVSTSSIIVSTQPVFVAVFAYLLVKQRFTVYSINGMFLLILGALLLGLNASSDRPEGESEAKYYKGFFLMLGAAGLYGLFMPLLEYTYRRLSQRITSILVMEVQMLICIAAMVFCLVGMTANNDFQAIPREAEDFGLGKTKYHVVIICSAIFWQLYNLVFISVISYSNSLLAGLLVALTIPLAEVFAVVLLHESFTSVKGAAVALSLWGFGSYLYGDWKEEQHMKKLAKSTMQREISLP